jgi:hypothetical protein
MINQEKLSFSQEVEENLDEELLEAVTGGGGCLSCSKPPKVSTPYGGSNTSGWGDNDE